MDTKEQLLAKLEQLKQQTIDLAEQMKLVAHSPHAERNLRRKWKAIAKEKAIKPERVRMQSEFRLGAVQGKYPVSIVEIVYGVQGRGMRLLVLDLMVLAEGIGVCLLEVSHKAAEQLLRVVYGEELPNPNEPGHLAASWERKEGLFSKDPAEKAKYDDYKLPKLPGRKAAEEKATSVPPASAKGAVPDMSELGGIGQGLVSHGKSIEAAAEMIVGAGLLALLFQQPKSPKPQPRRR